MLDVAETSRRMVGHTPTEQLSDTLFQKTKARAWARENLNNCPPTQYLERIYQEHNLL